MAKVRMLSHKAITEGGYTCDECGTCLCCRGEGADDKGVDIGKWLIVQYNDGYAENSYCPKCIKKALKAKAKEAKELQAIVAKMEKLTT